MKRKRSRQPYKAFLIAADGTRKRVKAYGIAIERGRGLVLELSLAPPPNHGGVCRYEQIRRPRRNLTCESSLDWSCVRALPM